MRFLYPLVLSWLWFLCQVKAGILNCQNLFSIDGQTADGCWSQDAWDDFWNLRNDLCSKTYQAGGGTYTFTLNGWAAQLQMVLQPGMTNEHCYDAFADLINTCFNTAIRTNPEFPSNDGTTYQTGTWATDPSLREWYWMDVYTGGSGWKTGCNT